MSAIRDIPKAEIIHLSQESAVLCVLKMSSLLSPLTCDYENLLLPSFARLKTKLLALGNTFI